MKNRVRLLPVISGPTQNIERNEKTYRKTERRPEWIELEYN